MSGFFRSLSVKIRRRETPGARFVYDTAKALLGFSYPVIPGVHGTIYHARIAIRNLWHEFWRIVYFEPLFKSQCVRVGSGFRMEYAGNGTAQIYGHLKVYIGDNVTMFDNTGMCGLKVNESPELRIGDNSYVGPNVRILVGDRVSIGKHCLVTSRMITDNPGHSTKNVMARLQPGGGSPDPADIRPVSIGDFCFLPLDTYVYPGVTVGDGVVARVGTHITKSVPPFCMVAGNPGRIVRKLLIPEELREIVGDERFESYLAEHERVQIERLA